MKMYVTLAELKALKPCKPGLKRLLRGIEYDKSYPDEAVVIPLDLIREVSGSEDAEWLLDKLNYATDLLNSTYFVAWCAIEPENLKNDLRVLRSWKRPLSDRSRHDDLS